MEAFAIGSVTCVQAAPKSINLCGPLCIMSKNAFTPTAALHCKNMIECQIMFSYWKIFLNCLVIIISRDSFRRIVLKSSLQPCSRSESLRGCFTSDVYALDKGGTTENGLVQLKSAATVFPTLSKALISWTSWRYRFVAFSKIHFYL